MKLLLTLVLITASFATSVVAEQLEYDLEVNGMVCAFCAYNVSKQLRTLDGVVPHTVDMDLEQGRVRLQSGQKLDRVQLADLILTAGFKLGAVGERRASNAHSGRQYDETVFLSMTINPGQLSDGQFDEVLEAIGAIAARRSGRISVTGPAEHELAILKPVLMGRRTVIEVEYDRVDRSDQAVVVALTASPSKTR